MRHYHIAQINIALMRAPLSDQLMAGFVAELARINAIADTSPGFVWRLQSEGGDATSIRAFDDDRILINMSVWQSVDALHAFTYRSDHRHLFRQRKAWFETLPHPSLTLWWVPADSIPSAGEGRERLDILAQQGATAQAFTFKALFPAPEP